jgi:hypothetical protein
MTSLAAIRPDSWNFPLLVHVLGAMVLMGLLAALLVVLVASLRGGDRVAALRWSFKLLLFGSIPAYLVMRVGAEWVLDEENVPDDVSWVGIGYMVADTGLLILIVLSILAGVGARRAATGGASGMVRWASALTALLLVGYAVALWAMTTKPA